MANNRRKRFGSRGIALLALLAVLVAAVGGTLAWLSATTAPIENTFTFAEVDIEINEAFNAAKTLKSNVSVQNVDDEDNIPVYIRVALVPTWQDDSGNIVGVPASLIDLTISWDDNGAASSTLANDWIKIGDYYYYTKPVDVGNSTAVLIKSAEVADSANAEAYHMDLQVVADAIQAEPDAAVESVWPVKVGADGTLSQKS